MGIYRHHTTANSFTETTPTSKMKIKTLDDGSTWARIHWLNVIKDKTYFANATEVADCIKSNRFSKMGLVDKMATSQVEITNLAPEINGTSGFSIGAANGSEGWRKYSAASLQLTGTTSAEITAQSSAATVPLVNGHTYYARVEIKQSTKQGTGEMFLGGSTAGGGVAAPNIITGQAVTAANTWTPISGIAVRTFPTGNHKFRLDYNNSGISGNTMCFDGLVIIDLTECFGAGSEPTKAWCDSNIPYFRGTMTINASSADYKRWEFMLTYPNLSATLYNRWSQTGSPNLSAPGGYKRITTPWTTHAGPLRKHGSSCIYNCDNEGSSTWFAPIGQTSAWSSSAAIPPAHSGNQTDAQTETELWIRIDNLSPANKARVYNDNSILASQFYEF